MLVFGFWLVRAAAARLSRPAPALQARGAGPAGPLLVPLVFYAAQALGRTALYWLHFQGYIFHPRRWAEPRQAHPPHVMSDHVLLAACAVAALACEAVMPLLSWRCVLSKSVFEGGQGALKGGILKASFALDAAGTRQRRGGARRLRGSTA